MRVKRRWRSNEDPQKNEWWREDNLQDAAQPVEFAIMRPPAKHHNNGMLVHAGEKPIRAINERKWVATSREVTSIRGLLETALTHLYISIQDPGDCIFYRLGEYSILTLSGRIITRPCRSRRPAYKARWLQPADHLPMAYVLRD